jgi:hypothetical protein
MVRKHIIGLSLVSALLAVGCAYDPISKDNTGRYTPEPPPVISEPLNLPVTNFDRRAPVPQKCKELGLSMKYWRTDNTILGLQPYGNRAKPLSVVSVTPSICYDVLTIDSKELTYPGLNIKYLDNNTLEIRANVSDANLQDYRFTGDARFGVIESITRVPSSDGGLVLNLKLTSKALYAVEYSQSGYYRAVAKIFLAHP